MNDKPDAQNDNAHEPEKTAGDEPATTTSATAEPAPVAEKSETGTELADAHLKIAELNDRLLRLAAEMENLRKRNERELADTRTYAISGFARDMLTATDSLAR
jgi:molecular chaperone GrpE